MYKDNKIVVQYDLEFTKTRSSNFFSFVDQC